MSPEEIFAFKIGGSSIDETLRRAIDSGAVRQCEDGALEIANPEPKSALFVAVHGGPSLPCSFLNAFLFKQVYAEAAVPQGCAACYKVKALPRTLRELVATYEVAKTFQCLSKWGIDFYNHRSPNSYAGYFYCDGLDKARELYSSVRTAMDKNPKLGADVPLVIKRGCSNYEAALGPSDKYTFAPELRAIEAYFATRFRAADRGHSMSLPAVLYRVWIPFAYQMGDHTYLDFTNGKPLYPKTVNYAPFAGKP